MSERKKDNIAMECFFTHADVGNILMTERNIDICCFFACTSQKFFIYLFFIPVNLILRCLVITYLCMKLGTLMINYESIIAIKNLSD